MNDDAAGAVPEGFGPIFRSSPVLDALGGFLSAGSAGSLRIGLRVGPPHLNSRGSLHGGVTATLADVGMGYLLAFGHERPRRLVTASLTLDYVDGAAAGAFVEVRLRSVDEGRQLIHATADLLCGERPIARARASFVVQAG
jgi:uncharacterized protein (TIGR00369 family)